MQLFCIFYLSSHHGRQSDSGSLNENDIGSSNQTENASVSRNQLRLKKNVATSCTEYKVQNNAPFGGSRWSSATAIQQEGHRSVSTVTIMLCELIIFFPWSWRVCQNSLVSSDSTQTITKKISLIGNHGFECEDL